MSTKQIHTVHCFTDHKCFLFQTIRVTVYSFSLNFFSRLLNSSQFIVFAKMNRFHIHFFVISLNFLVNYNLTLLSKPTQTHLYLSTFYVHSSVQFICRLFFFLQILQKKENLMDIQELRLFQKKKLIIVVNIHICFMVESSFSSQLFIPWLDDFLRIKHKLIYLPVSYTTFYCVYLHLSQVNNSKQKPLVPMTYFSS